MKLPELPALVAGKVFVLQETRKRDDDGRMVPDGGVKVGVIGKVAGVTGATEVKLDENQRRVLNPLPDDNIAWYVEPRPYSVDGNSGVTFVYRGSVVVDDLADLSQSIMDADVPATASK